MRGNNWKYYLLYVIRKKSLEKVNLKFYESSVPKLQLFSEF